MLNKNQMGMFNKVVYKVKLVYSGSCLYQHKNAKQNQI